MVSAVIAVDVLITRRATGHLTSAVTSEAWSSVFSSLSQVAATLVVASVAIPFLITTFSVHDTTRALSRIHARNLASWYGAATGCAATASAIYASFGLGSASHAPEVGELALGLLLVTMLLLISGALVAWTRLDPYRLAEPAVRQLTPSSVKHFGLVERSGDGFRLVSHNLDFRTSDPLGSLHELMRVAWGAQDRVLVLHLLETMLRRALRFDGAVYRPVSFRQLFTDPPRSAIPLGRRLRVRDEMVLVHALHYFVRNARTSAYHWGDRPTDGPRRVFVLPILVAHRSLAGSERHVQSRMRLVDALAHIAMRTSHLPAVGVQEPFALLPLLAANVTASNELDRLLPTIALARDLYGLSDDATFLQAFDRGLRPGDRHRIERDLQTPERILEELSATASQDPWQLPYPLGPRYPSAASERLTTASARATSGGHGPSSKP